MVLGTAGHIDHGKSALVQALTGINPDRLKEEQRRGITIDLGFAHAEIDGVTVAFVDVPGHERFVRNMLAGVGGIDAVLLVVAADESVMPQTREHFHICTLLGIERGIVALTKADLADAEMRAVAESDVRDLVRGSFLEGAPVVAVSAQSGEGMDELRHAIAALAGGPARQARDGLVRLPIDRVFTVKGFGAVITGTLVSGEIRIGDELAVLPGPERARVRGLQVHGAAASVVRAPQRVAVNLSGVDAADLARGQTLATPGSLAVTHRLDLHMRLLPEAAPLRHGSRVRVHHGTSEILGRIAISATRSSSSDAWARAAIGALGVAVTPGGEAFVRARLEAPGVFTRGDRLVLRSYSPPVTIGGGVVLDPEPPPAGLRRTGALERFLRLDAASAAAAVVVMLEGAAGAGLDRGALTRRAGMGLAEARRTWDEADRLDAVTAGERMFAAGESERRAAMILEALAKHHAARPAEPGMPRETLRSLLSGSSAPELVDHACGRLAAAGRIAGSDRVALATHRPARSADDTRIRTDLAAELRGAGLTPPDLQTLAVRLGAPRAAVEREAQALAREKTLVRLEQVYFHEEVLARLKADIKALGGAPGAAAAIDVALFKQRYGLTRKFAIPLLEWLDRERITRRVGETRIVL